MVEMDSKAQSNGTDGWEVDYHIPIDTRDINHDIDHVTAELVGLHVHWGTADSGGRLRHNAGLHEHGWHWYLSVAM